MSYEVAVDVMLKAGIADPQGQTIERALPALGYSGATNVRVGKRIELTIEAPSRGEAHDVVVRMCEQLLANTVIESYEIQVAESSGSGAGSAGPQTYSGAGSAGPQTSSGAPRA